MEDQPPEMNIITKNSPSTGTCFNKDFPTMLDGFYTQIKDTFFFSYIIQFILIALMYSRIGSGQYWKILFFGSLSGLIGSMLENITLAYICQDNQRENYNQVFTFFISELFWIFTEYSIPYLNLIKMKAISKGGLAKSISYLIYLLFIPFALMRFSIGYNRMIKGYLNDKSIEVYHGIAFGVMAVADILCSIFIIYFIKKYNQRVTLNPSGFMHYIQHSSYTILITIDIVGVILSLLYIYVNLINSNGAFLTSKSVIPFHSFKSVFHLILAIDACLFKYGANLSSSTHGSSDYNITSKGPGPSSNHDLNIKNNNYYSIDVPIPPNIYQMNQLNNKNSNNGIMLNEKYSNSKSRFKIP